MPDLFPHQAEAIDNLRNSIRNGKRKILMVAPCAFGKTVVMAEIIRSFREKSKGLVLVLVHRQELVDQTLGEFGEVGIEAGVIMAKDHRANWRLPVQVASISTLARRMDRLPDADLIFADEAHHSLSDTWRAVVEKYPKAILIGLTATPFRCDKIGMGDLYDDLIVGATPSYLISTGYLVDYEAFSYKAPDLAKVHVKMGEYNQKELADVADKPELIGNIVDEWMKYAGNRRTICFPINVKHSQNIVAEFRARGIVAQHLDGTTPSKQRRNIIEGLTNGSITVVSSCGVLSEGFNCRPAEVAILGRPTKSLSLYIQQVGRVLRTSPGTGKKSALIHDHGGNIHRHMLPDFAREYSLDPTDPAVQEMHTCLNCHAVVVAWKRDGTCPRCGDLQRQPVDEDEQRDMSDAPSTKEIIVVAGVRVSMKEVGKVKELFRSQKIDRDLTDHQAALVSRATRSQKAQEYMRLRRVQREKNFKEGFIAQQFRATFGHWPRWSQYELEGVMPALYPFLPIVDRKKTSNGQES
jgi:superfamily II DNA or RNA helicase